MKFKYKIFIFCISVAIASGCKKLVKIPEPVNTLTTTEVFASNADATSAVINIYNDLNSTNGAGYFFAVGGSTVFCGLSADELNYFYGSDPFQTNSLLKNNTNVLGYFWTPPYKDIYYANAVLEGLQGSKGVDAATSKQLTGETKFLRALSYFYLVNLFGDVPLVTSTAWAKTDTLHRAPSALIYRQMIADLTDAKNSLPADYSVSGGERIRANKWSAQALLARVYLYWGDYSKDQSNYAKAETQADSVINSNQYNLLSNLNNVFLKNSSEAILQWQWNANQYPYTEPEGPVFIPYDPTANPNYYLTDALMNAFESGDQRKIAWIGSSVYAGVTYHYPFKYKVLNGTQGNVTEYYMVLRLSEQYLIRAEARAQQNKLPGAIGDINVIRVRAQLPALPLTLTQTQVLAAVAQERRIELFAEWGHRWLDLKRTGQAVTVLSANKGFSVSNNVLLYPIPAAEQATDPNLSQNPGY